MLLLRSGKKSCALKFKKVNPNESCDIKITFCKKEHGDDVHLMVREEF